MRVWELIEVLAALDPDLPVWHDGGGDPWCSAEVKSVTIDRMGPWYDEPDKRVVWLNCV